ncbi:MAG TPA: hypothetical protein VHO24_16655 [Opitutaceae bacterium]|nr:hypothetical protein [Opitutaceae bacterium]
MTPHSKRLVDNLIIFVLLLVILWVDSVIFRRWFQIEHWRWYLENGVEIGFVSAAVALVWKEFFESRPDLVSAEPRVYYGAHFQVIGACIETMGVQLQSDPGKPRPVPLHEILFGLPLLLVLVAALIVWLVVVVPAQYFLVLVCGAPARVFARAPYRLVIWYEGDLLRTRKIPRDQPVPENRLVASLSDQPMAVTSLFVSLVLVVVGHFIP